MATKRISAPYSFVPLNGEVYIPEWYNKVSQDIPFEDGEDGIIEVAWRNVSPLIIRDGSCGKKETAQSAYVDLPDGTRRYFIPGSSLKGMLRNVMAIMSFGKFNEYSKACFSKRVKKEKVPYRYGVEDLVRRGQPSCGTEEHDLCETIFGWTDGNSMKGRVQVGHAFCVNEANMLMSERSGVLGQPKASYYPLYLKQNENNNNNKKYHITYDNEKAQVSGWKRYRIHRGSTVSDLPEGNGNENTTSGFCPLRPGLIFTMRISVHNLRKVEIGALLSAITFHHTEGVWHSLGGAKSFGYGKLECEYSSIKLSGLQYDKGDYLAAFETEMNNFTQSKIKEDWTGCDRMKTLVAIASEHTDDVVRMMELDEYTSTKKYSTKENSDPDFYLPYPENASRGLTSALTEEYKMRQLEEARRRRVEKVRENLSPRNTEIETLRGNGNLDQAKQKLEELIRLLQREGVPTEPEHQQLEALKHEIDEQRQRAQECRAQEEKAKQEAYINNGLAGALNEMYPDGARFKVDCWKTCADKLKTWMKRNKEDALTAGEQDVLAEVVCRLKDNPKDKKEAKDWQQSDSKIWKAVAGYLSKERADRLFNNEERHD